MNLLLLWLWCRLAAVAPIGPPSLGTSLCLRCSSKKQKKKKKKSKKQKNLRQIMSPGRQHCVHKGCFKRVPLWLSRLRIWSCHRAALVAAVARICSLVWELLHATSTAPQKRPSREGISSSVLIFLCFSREIQKAPSQLCSSHFLVLPVCVPALPKLSSSSSG